MTSLLMHDLVQSLISYNNIFNTFSGVNCLENTVPSLSEFAQYVLKEICNQEWVLDRCLLNPVMLCEALLVDTMLSPKQVGLINIQNSNSYSITILVVDFLQAQRLLHMICYPEIAASTDNCLDHKTIIDNIVQVRSMS